MCVCQNIVNAFKNIGKIVHLYKLISLMTSLYIHIYIYIRRDFFKTAREAQLPL